MPQLTVAARGDNLPTARERLPPYWALFGRGHLRWTTVGILSGVCAGTAGFLIHMLLPKALVNQGTAVTFSFGLSSLVYFASIPGKGFTEFLMEIIGRRWTIAYALAGSLPGLFLMLMSHRAGQYATGVMVAGADHRLHRTVGLRRHPSLPVQAIPDGAARAGNTSARRSGGPSPASWRHF